MVKHRIKTLEEFHAEHPKSGRTEGYDCGDLVFIPDMWHLAGTVLTDDETEKILRRKKAQLTPKNAPRGQDNRWYFNKEMIRPLVMSGDLRQMLQSIVEWRSKVEAPAEFKNLLINAENLLKL